MTTGPEQLELRALVEDALGVEMSPLDRAIMARRLGWDGAPLSQQAVAREVGLSQPAICNRERIIKDRIRRVMAERGQQPQTWYLLPSDGVLKKTG